MSKRMRRDGARSARALQLSSYPGDFETGAAGHRTHRLEHILLEQLQALVRDEVADPALSGIHLVAARLSIDGGHARVAYAVEASPGTEEQAVKRATGAALARATPFLRTRLAGQLDCKRVPSLSFTFVGLHSAGGDSEGGAPWSA